MLSLNTPIGNMEKRKTDHAQEAQQNPKSTR